MPGHPEPRTVRLCMQIICQQKSPEILLAQFSLQLINKGWA
jgi:hypothetical protein